MQIGEPDVDELTAILSRTPVILTSLLTGLPDLWVMATEGEGTWSPYDVLGHLIHGERTDWIPRTRHILEGREDPFEPFDREGQFTASPRASIHDLLKTFVLLRQQNLDTLASFHLTGEDLTRRGVHPDLGEVTLGQLLTTWTVHDLDHVAQIARTMAKVCASAVGPWEQYLSILHDRR